MMRSQPLFFRTIYDEDALADCFSELLSARLAEQDKIEIGCLVQYFLILKSHGLCQLPVDITKHRQGEGPDFSICDASGLFGVEMTKVTTRDYQIWLKRRMNYSPIRDIEDYLEFKPERRVADLSRIRVERKNYKITNYFASVREMDSCDLVLEEDGDCSLNSEVLLHLLRHKIGKVRYQRFRRISMISGSQLYYAINTNDACVLSAPETIPDWLKIPAKPSSYASALISLQ